MTLCVLFYILMLLWLIFGVWSNLPGLKTDWRPAGGTLLLFLLLLCLGWAVFGAPVK
jgi:hypothetical protein